MRLARSMLALAAALVGCGDDSGSPADASALLDAPSDASADARVDARAIDAPAIDAPPMADASDGGVLLPPLTTGSPSNSGPADYTCNGSRTDPPGAATAFTVSGSVVDLQSRNPVPGATVSDFVDVAAVLSGTPFDTKTTDSFGQFTGLAIPAGHYRISFEITAPPCQAPTYEIGVAVPAGTTSMTRSSVSDFTMTALPGMVGVNYDASTALVLATVEDCAGAPVHGAVVSVDANGPLPESNVFYFSDQDLPVRRSIETYTNFDGLVMALDVPPVAAASITASGVVGSGSPQTIGTSSVPLFVGAITFTPVLPLSP